MNWKDVFESENIKVTINLDFDEGILTENESIFKAAWDYQQAKLDISNKELEEYENTITELKDKINHLSDKCNKLEMKLDVAKENLETISIIGLGTGGAVVITVAKLRTIAKEALEKIK